jgi:hypothetical protein
MKLVALTPLLVDRYLEVRRQALCDNLLHRDLSPPSIARAHLLRDHPGCLSKKRGHLNQLIDLPRYSIIRNHAPTTVPLSIPSHASLTPRPLAPAHTRSLSGILRQGCRATVVAPMLAFRSCGGSRTTEDRDAFALRIRSKLPRALLQDNTFHRKRRRMGLTALRRGKYSELASVVEENNPGRVTSGIQFNIQR